MSCGVIRYKPCLTLQFFRQVLLYDNWDFESDLHVPSFDRKYSYKYIIIPIYHYEYYFARKF